MVNYDVLNFQIRGNHDGSLVALENSKEIPFDVKRVYYIWGTKRDVIRGRHAHRKLEQVIICMSGNCDFILDNGTEKETVHLDNPSKGLLIRHNIWREFTNFSPDCVIMVLASERYDESDYIRDYETFLQEVRNNKINNDKTR